MKKSIIIERVNYGQYKVSTEIAGAIYSAFTTDSQLIDQYKGSDKPDSEQQEEMAGDKLYDLIYKNNSSKEEYLVTPDGIIPHEKNILG